MAATTALIEVVTKNGTTQAQVRSLTSEVSQLPTVKGSTVTVERETVSNGVSRLDINLNGSQSPDDCQRSGPAERQPHRGVSQGLYQLNGFPTDGAG